jgi:hypothetical protein
MAKIPSAEEVGLPIGCGVQHSVVGGVRQHEWADDHWLDDAGHIGQALGEPRSFVRGDSIAGLQSRIKKHALYFMQDEALQNESVSIKNNIQEAQCGPLRACGGSNQDIGIERDFQSRLSRTAVVASSISASRSSSLGS